MARKVTNGDGSSTLFPVSEKDIKGETPIVK